MTKAELRELVPESRIVEFKPFEKDLAEFKQKYVGVVYDLDDEEQNKQARSDRLAIGKVVAKLDAKHKDIKAPLAEKVALIDGERKRIKDELLTVQDGIKTQIKAHEEKIAAHQEMLQQKVDKIESQTEWLNHEPTSHEIEARIAQLNDTDIDDSYEHRKADATLAKVDTLKALEAMLSIAQKREADQAELDRLREEQESRLRAEREEKIRKEAAEKAKKEAEAIAQAQAELKKRQLEEAERAKERAEKEKEEAEANAKRLEEHAKLVAEQAAQAERDRAEQEQQRLAKEAKAREADKANKAKVHNEILKALLSVGINEKQGKAIVVLLAKNEVPRVKISY